MLPLEHRKSLPSLPPNHKPASAVFHRSGADAAWYLRPDPTGARRPRRYSRRRGDLRRCDTRPARQYYGFGLGLRTHRNITVG